MKILWKCVWGIASILLLISVATVQAEESPYREERAGKAPEMPAGLLFGEQDIFVEFHVFLNMEGFNFQSEAEHPIPSFDLHNWYFAAKAQVAKEFVLFGELEYEHGTEDIRLDRAFLDWETSPWATVRIGRFYVPVSYERTHYQAPVRLMTSRPFMADIAFHEWSDTGLEVYGKFPGIKKIEYDLAAVNGPRGLSESGIPVSLREDDRDNNRNKAAIARVNVYPLQGLTVGASYATGKYDDGGTLDFKIIEFDSRYRFGRLDIWGEYMKRTGDDEPAPSPGTDPFITGTKAGQEGYYLLVAYDIVEERDHVFYLRPIVRYDTIKETSSGAGERRVTIGLNYSPKRHIQFKSEYQLTREIGGPQLKNNGVMFSAVVDF